MPNAYETANKKAGPVEVTGRQASPTRGEEVRMRETLVESGEPKPAESPLAGEATGMKPIAAFLPTWRDEITGHVLTLDELRKALCAE